MPSRSGATHVIAMVLVGCGGVACPDGRDDPTIDVDGNGAADCGESLVINGQLRGDTQPWEAGPDVTIAYDERDALDSEGSGALRVTSSADDSSPTFRHAEQCVPLVPEQRYLIAARYFIAPDQGVPGLGAQIQLQLYEQPGCGGDPGSPQVTDIEMEEGRWLVLSREVTAPRAQSALVRLTVRKSAGAQVGEVLFDDVLVRPL